MAKSIYSKILVFFVLVIAESVLGCFDYFGVFILRLFSEFLLLPLTVLASMIFVEYFKLQDFIDGGLDSSDKETEKFESI